MSTLTDPVLSGTSANVVFEPKMSLSETGDRSSEMTVGLSYDDETTSIDRVPSTESGSRPRSSISSYEKMSELGTVLDDYRNEVRAKRNSGIHERLYEDGRAKELQKAFALQRKMKEEQLAPRPKLQMATRSYTPQRQRMFEEEPACERLYKMGDFKKRLEIEREARMAAQRAVNKPRSISSNSSGKRLYAHSKARQEEGKLLRQKIEGKRKGRASTPSRAISLTKASAIYDRGVQAKNNTKKKIEELRNAPRESTFPKMRTQTPNRRDRYFEARESENATRNSTHGQSRRTTPSQARYPTPSRSRNPAPSIRNKSSPTPSHGLRSQTPSRFRSETPSRRRNETPSRPRNETPIRSRKASQQHPTSSSRSSSRARTSSRPRGRSQTPSRRISSSHVMNRPETDDIATSTPKLPRSFKLNSTD